MERAPTPLAGLAEATPRMRVVVTGAAGQLGRMLALHLIENGASQSAGSLLTPSAEWLFLSKEQLDIADSRLALTRLRSLNPDVVVNCAAYTRVDRAEEEPALAEAINAQGVRNLLETTERVGSGQSGCTIVHISTDYVFGGQDNTPRSELATPRPQCAYALSKRKGELALLGHPRGMVLRTGWLYSHYEGNFFTAILNRCLRNEPLRVVYDQVGCPTWAGSLAKIIACIVEKRTLAGGLYHCSDLGVASWYDFAVAIRRAASCNNDITPIRSSGYPQRAERPAYSVLDGEQTRMMLSHKGIHWLDALQLCLNTWHASRHDNPPY